jgi:GT2 family glycosyltransferase
MMRLAVLVTCYNRVETSLASLRRLDACLTALPEIDATIFAIDDASPDGTGGRLKEAIPGLVLAYGNGNLFWNGGMCSAYRLARKHGSFDAYLLFNDDVIVDAEAIKSFFADFRRLNAQQPAILVGSTRSREGGEITYTALRRVSLWRPMAIERVMPNGTLQPCDSFNGNFVMVPGAFFEEVGGLDPRYKHAYGDLDLGYVAGQHGILRLLAAEPIGWCEPHAPLPPPTTWLERLQRKTRGMWVKHDSFLQRSYFLLKHASLPAAAPQIALAAAKRVAARITEALN